MSKRLLIALMIGFSTPALAAGYVEGIDDLPLMPGLAQGEATVFDQAEGRIVESAASGAADPAAVRKFYSDSLPQLGWTATGDRWTRDGESLSLDIKGGTVHFRLAPNK